MPAGPLVNWWGGVGGAPPPVPALDKFTPKFLIGNATAGDGTSTSIAGFTYILDPGDGSGILQALALVTSGDIAIRPGLYAFPVPTTLNVPENVKITGAGRGTTLIANAAFSLAEGASLADMSVASGTGTTTVTVTAASQGLLRDVSLASDFQAIHIVGPGIFSIENVDVILSEQEQSDSSVLVTDSAEVLCRNLQVSGGLASLEIRDSSIVRGVECSFTGALTALVVVDSTFSFTDTVFQSLGAEVVGIQDCLNSRFDSCAISGTNCVDLSATTILQGLNFTNCLLTASAACFVGLSTLGTVDNLHIRDSVLSAGSGSSLAALNLVTNFSVIDSTLTSTGATAVYLNTEANLRGCTISSTAGSACILDADNTRVSDCVLTGASGGYSLEVQAENCSFSGVFVYGGGVHLSTDAAQCSFVTSRVDITTAAPMPLAAVVVEGDWNTFGLITYTTQGIPSIHFAATATNNIVLSVIGRGAPLIPVVDLGFDNEVAHSAGDGA